MKHLVAVLAVLFVVAATPADMATEIEVTGYHVDRNASATNECVSQSVSDARNAGGNLYIVVLAEEPAGGATTFSEATLTELGVVGTVFTVSPESIGYRDIEEFWSVAEFNQALDEASAVASDNDVVRTFVNSLTGDDAVCSTTDIAGKSSWGFIVFVVIVVGGIGFLIWRSAKSGKRRRAEAMAEAKRPLQQQIDDIANDILDLEDEVREAAHPDVTMHFTTATEQFTQAPDRLKAASTADALLDLGYELDVTIWHLDCAEALLDGNPVPDKPTKPEPPKIEPPPAPPAPAPDVADDLPPTLSPEPSLSPELPRTLPEYQRRTQRKSQYGSEGLMTALLAMQAMKGTGGFGGGFAGGQGGSGGRGRSTSGAKPPRSKGSRGGRRRG